MDYKKLAKALGLKMKVSHLQSLDVCSVTGPDKRVLAFRRESFTYGIDWFFRDDETSVYYFITIKRREA